MVLKATSSTYSTAVLLLLVIGSDFAILKKLYTLSLKLNPIVNKIYGLFTFIYTL